MIWANLIMQAELVPPALAQPAVAVGLLWCVLQIVKEIRGMIGGKNGHHANDDKLIEHRFKQLEEQVKERITRTEYESRHADMLHALRRMEGKLDNLIGIRRLFTGDHEDKP